MGHLTPEARGHLAMLAFSALVAGSFALGGLVANDLAPPALNALRFFFAALLMGALVLATGGITRKDLEAPWRYVILGGLFVTYFVLMFEGLKTAPPVSTAAVFTLTPALTAVCGYVMLRQVTTRWMAAALAVGAAGACWVIFRADLSALLAFEVGRGELIYFLGCLFHAVFTPALKLFSRGERSLVYTFLFMVAGLGLLIVWGWGPLTQADWGAMPARLWWAIGYLAVFSSAASFFLLQYGAKVLPSAKVMAYSYLTPSWVILWQIGLGNGAPPALILVGVGLSIVSLLMLLRGESAA